MLDNITKARINTARNILVSKVSDPKGQVEQINIALIYKFMDEMDKESVNFGGEATLFIGEYEKYAILFYHHSYYCLCTCPHPTEPGERSIRMMMHFRRHSACKWQVLVLKMKGSMQVAPSFSRLGRDEDKYRGR